MTKKVKKLIPLLFIVFGCSLVYAYQHWPQDVIQQTPTVHQVIKIGPTVQEICTPGYASSVRDVSVETKKQVYARDHVAYEPGKYVVDHIVSLELGGSNDISNLQVQTIEEGKQKDRIEDLLHDRLCSGQITIEQAQEQIINWKNVH